MATFSHFQSIWKDFPSSPLIMEFVVLLYFVSSLYQIRKFPSIHRLLGDFHLFFYFIMDFYWILSNVFLNLSKLLYGFPFSSVNMINHSDLLSNVKSYIEYRWVDCCLRLCFHQKPWGQKLRDKWFIWKLILESTGRNEKVKCYLLNICVKDEKYTWICEWNHNEHIYMNICIYI